jgi:hypothetical protein
MTEIEKQLKAALGTAGFFLLRKQLKRIGISFDADSKMVFMSHDGKEPVGYSFKLIEDFVNNVD